MCLNTIFPKGSYFITTKRAKSKLPKFVAVRDGIWFVRRLYPTKNRDAKNRIVYLQITRRCEPETAEAAAEIAEQIDYEFRAELTRKSKPVTVDDYFTRFLEVKDGSVERRTFEYYGSLFDRYIQGTAFGSLLLSEVRLMDVEQSSDIQRFYASLKSGGASADAVRRVHAFLSIAFNQAVKWEQLDRNPCRGALLPKANTEEVTFFDQAEARAFVAACRQDEKFIIFEFALETGMRPGEYLALAWGDVDIAAYAVRVSRAVTVGLKGGGYQIKEPKTRGSKRTIRISPQLAERLQVQRRSVDARIAELSRRKAEPLLLDHMKAKGKNYQMRRVRRRVAADALANMARLDLVFPAANGGPGSRLNLNKREFPEALGIAGLDASKYSLYTLRHSSISLSLAAGVDIKTISQRAGHSNIVTTLKTYSHVLPSMAENATEKLSGILY